ncbi:hypothetical protein GGI07_004571 [Coemansia sp. Benny D115]|nr:hypothetical protein GGI07_004571 [Coemansia sp. Benny D115]
MSLSRLPQVALRRLMPAITAVPKSLDDDQLKKLLESQQNQTLSKLTSQIKSELSSLTGSTQANQGLLSTLAKLSSSAGASSSAGVSSTLSTASLNKLLLSLTGSQGRLSTQELALLQAANTSPTFSEDSSASLLTTPEPASPASEPLLLLEHDDAAPSVGALDPASVDALVSALRGTTTEASEPAKPAAPRIRAPRRESAAPERALEEHNELASAFEHSDDDLAPISNELSAAERRKEQNRRAQKKFRQKDKVRQKEVKWRAAQYEDLVESNKRFKKDIDEVTRERDRYRQLLELNGIDVDSFKPRATQPVAQSVTLEKLRASLGQAAAVRSPSLASTATAITSPLVSPSISLLNQQSQQHLQQQLQFQQPTMDQIAQDTFGTMPAMNMPQGSLASMNLLLSSMINGAVKADPMFGYSAAALLAPTAAAATTSPTASASAPVPAPAAPLLTSSATMVTPPAADAGDVNAAALADVLNVQSPGGGVWLDAALGLPSTASASAPCLAADTLLVESPLIADYPMLDVSGSSALSFAAPAAAQQPADAHPSAVTDAHFVDHMAFIDEFLSASPKFSAAHHGGSIGFSRNNMATSTSLSRKRSFDDTF